MTLGEQITRASGSNFSWAFLTLPKQKRQDITNFYAFCRLVDDLADDPGPTLEERQAALSLWRQAVRQKTAGEHLLAPDLRETLQRYSINCDLLDDLISGMEMDLRGQRYETLQDLKEYCYRVAGAVGLVSIEIFGYKNPSARDHARALGEALQLTNILRDVADDYRNGERIYLPLADMRAWGCSEKDIKAERLTPGFQTLMRSLAEIAENDYALADSFVAAEDRTSLRPGLIMGEIYRRVLGKMKRDDFRVFTTRYRLNRMEKLFCVLRRSFFTF